MHLANDAADVECAATESTNCDVVAVFNVATDDARIFEGGVVKNADETGGGKAFAGQGGNTGRVIENDASVLAFTVVNNRIKNITSECATTNAAISDKCDNVICCSKRKMAVFDGDIFDASVGGFTNDDAAAED